MLLLLIHPRSLNLLIPDTTYAVTFEGSSHSYVQTVTGGTRSVYVERSTRLRRVEYGVEVRR